MGHREDLLAAARRLLEDKGYAHITARDLVAASDTNLASIGYHFGSKAGLLNAAIGQVLDEWTEQLADIAMSATDATPVERAHITWVALLENLDSKRALLVSFMEAVAQADRSPELREQFAKQYQHVRGRVAELVATSMAERLGADDPRAAAIASFVMATCDGLALQWLLDPGEAPSAEQLRAGLDLVWSMSGGYGRGPGEQAEPGSE
ncbi:TetR/AcrR family transcriptional regulator [Haloechinothrix sp. YIM 98757]|uniref:TetR/AcrR family transcriptional regulator n=1 Tax=Haloechinothrix aidingensis TaxID=2752311 RepID=A0A838A3E2_9PSEU|nr:TetR/AcrR family transcriptional regulator [Haloechinothrix aidingensis]